MTIVEEASREDAEEEEDQKLQQENRGISSTTCSYGGGPTYEKVSQRDRCAQEQSQEEHKQHLHLDIDDNVHQQQRKVYSSRPGGGASVNHLDIEAHAPGPAGESGGVTANGPKNFSPGTVYTAQAFSTDRTKLIGER